LAYGAEEALPLTGTGTGAKLLTLSRNFATIIRYPKQRFRNVSIRALSSYDILPIKVKVKERIVLREIHLRTTRRHLSNGITQCYLLPDRGGRSAFTPTGQVGTRFIDPIRMKG